jgi:hypothetical protein
VFKVLRFAKKHDDWNCIADWIDRIDPDSLSDKPIKTEDIRDGWSDQEIWYNLKINCYLEHNDPGSALTLCTSLEGKYPKNAKFFSRLKALSYRHLKKYDESIEIYKTLCTRRRPDWWLLHEYGKVLMDANKEQEALEKLCNASLLNSKLTMSIKLYQDIGKVFSHFNQKKDAFYHYLLVKLIRMENNWPVSLILNSELQILEKELDIINIPQDTNSCLKICREIWLKHTENSNNGGEKREIKRNLRGKISIALSKPICFINLKDGFSAICFRNDLPNSILNDDIVEFDAEPSFDKKKNCDSWRAVRVHKV